MSITAGSDILASDFISTSAGAGDSGKVPKLNSSGKIDSSFLKFGGTGADGALTITSGATNIDLGGLAVVIKNYTSISITGTGYLTFTNPHANGTTIILRSQGAVTITSSATRAIDLRSLGGSEGNGRNGFQFGGDTGNGMGGSGGAGGGSIDFGSDGGDQAVLLPNGMKFGGRGGIRTAELSLSKLFAVPGGNGSAGLSGSGINTNTGGGAGGRGAGGLCIECAGAYNFAGATIDASGANGSNASNAVSGGGGGGGGGGAGGKILVVYGSVIADSGTYTLTGGSGGSGGTSGYGNAGLSGGAGSAGETLRGVNAFFA